jgi:Ca2+-transporting ATPase
MYDTSAGIKNGHNYKAEPMPYSSHVFGKIKKIVTLDFTNDRKAMSTVVTGFHGSGNSLLIKGAPERIIKNCDTYRTASGQTTHFSNADKAAMIKHVQTFASQGRRIIGLSVIEDGGQLASLTSYNQD